MPGGRAGKPWRRLSMSASSPARRGGGGSNRILGLRLGGAVEAASACTLISMASCGSGSNWRDPCRTAALLESVVFWMCMRLNLHVVAVYLHVPRSQCRQGVCFLRVVSSSIFAPFFVAVPLGSP